METRNSLVLYKAPEIAKPVSKIDIQKIAINSASAFTTGILLLMIINIAGKNVSMEYLFNRYIMNKYIQFNSADIDFYTESTLYNDKVQKKILQGMNLLTGKLGKSAYSGNVVLKFERSIYDGMVRPSTSMLVGRVIQFPSMNEFLTMNNRLFIHELVHCGFTNEKVYRNLPDFVVEGLTEAVTSKCMGIEENEFNASLQDYYLSSLSGFVDPDLEFSDVEYYKRPFYYFLGKMFFHELAEIDELLLYEVLRNFPEEKMKWSDFTQWLVSVSRKPDEIRDLINTTYLFSPLKQNIYVVPEMQMNKIVTVHVFDESHKNYLSQTSCSCTYLKNTEKLTRKTYADKGYFRMDLPWCYGTPVGEVDITILTSAYSYHQTITLNN